MSNSSAASNGPAASLSPLRIIGVLPPVPGGEANLLPRDAWLLALRVEFDLWSDSTPADDAVDVLHLIWNGDESNPVDTKSFTGPITEADRENFWLEVPVSKLDEGVHSLYYKLLPWNGSTPRTSVPVDVTIDKTAPTLATPSTLVFPPEVRPPNELTAYYLEDEDKLRADIPPYNAPKVGDVITWYWDQSSSGTTIGGTKELTALDYNKPLFIDIEGEWIRSQGDGDRFAWYTVTDRAGNPPNGQSAVERLIVKAQPIPRVLPPPKVVETGAVGWPANGTLNPINATNGVKVLLNPTSVIHPDEVPQVRWGNEGDLGYYLADPVRPDVREYEIPRQYMAPFFGKVLPVDYLFRDKKGELHESARFNLTVSLYPKDRLAAPQVAEGSPLSLALVPPIGASITMAAWPFIAAGQQVMIRVEGQEDSSGRFIHQVVYDRHVVTPAQAAAGIIRGEALVEKAFLLRIRLNTNLVVKAYVSFDNGQTWDGGAAPNPNVQHFPWLRPTLIP